MKGSREGPFFLRASERHDCPIVNSSRSFTLMCVGALLLPCLALLTHPYAGLRHDGILYLGQVLNKVYAGALDADIFFAHGSQDQFSIYSSVLAPLYSRFSITAVQISLLLLTQLTTYSALNCLLRQVHTSAARWLGLAFVAALAHGYGATRLMSFAEDFLTARSFAEPLTLWGLVMLAESRTGLGAALLVAAFLFHPLMTLPAMLISWLMLVQMDHRWTRAGVLFLLPPALAVMDVGPFAALVKSYDSSWWTLVNEVNDQVVLKNWEWLAWQDTLTDFAVLLAASTVVPIILRRLFRATLLAGALLMAATAIGVDMQRNLLVTQLQPWRVMWILHALSLAFAPFLLWRSWHLGPKGRVLCVILTAGLFAVNARAPTAWVLLAWAGLWWLLLRSGRPISRPILWAATTVAVLCIAGVCASDIATRHLLSFRGYDAATQRPLFIQVLAEPALALSASAVCLYALAHGGIWRWPAGCGLAFLVACSAAYGDTRSEWIRVVEAGSGSKHPFEVLIPHDAQVYWPNELAATWVLLRRAGYYQKAMGAGLLFNEGTARAFGPRWTAWKDIRAQEQTCLATSALNDHDPGNCLGLTQPQVQDLCRTQRSMDYVILDRQLAAQPLASWSPHLSSYAELTFNLYACQQFR